MIAQTDQNFNSKPTPLPVLPDNIPDELKALRRWVIWRYEFHNGKWTKVPYNARVFYDTSEEHKKADKTNPKHWSSFDSCLSIYQQHGHEIDGIGFCLTATDGIVSIDADKTLGTENEPLLLKTPTYCERSPSGKGLRFFGRATLPENTNRKREWLELYGHNAYVTVTGQTIPDRDNSFRDIQDRVNFYLQRYFTANPKPGAATSRPVGLTLSDEAILDLCRKAGNASKFNALFDWDTKALVKLGYVKEDGTIDRSKTDMALCSMLAFYTDDAEQVERIAMASGLERFTNAKQTYRTRTVSKAMDPDRERYHPPVPSYSEEEVNSVVVPFDDLVFENEPEDDDILLTLSTIKRRADKLKTSKVWAADKWIQVGKLGLFHGKAKRGKSTALMDLQAALMTGDKWLHLIPCHRMPVLLIDYENEEDYLADNLLPMIEAHGGNWVDHEEDLFIVDPQRINQEFAPFDAAKVCDLIRRIKDRTRQEAGLFLIDTARPAFNGLFDEANWEWSADRVRDALKLGHEVKRETGWGGIVIHHDTKAGNSPSGSGDWEGAVDYSIAYQLDAENREARISWLGRQVEPPSDVVFEKAGAVLTGWHVGEKTQVTQAMLDIRIKSFVTEDRQNQGELVLSVQNGWKGDDVPGVNAIRASLDRLSTSGEIRQEKGPKNATLFWTPAEN